MLHGVGVGAEDVDQPALNELEQLLLSEKRRFLGVVGNIGLDDHADVLELGYQVAACLNEGMIYNDILAQTGASSATISRVNRSLQYGKGGYDIVFQRTEEGEK